MSAKPSAVIIRGERANQARPFNMVETLADAPASLSPPAEPVAGWPQAATDPTHQELFPFVLGATPIGHSGIAGTAAGDDGDPTRRPFDTTTIGAHAAGSDGAVAAQPTDTRAGVDAPSPAVAEIDQRVAEAFEHARAEGFAKGHGEGYAAGLAEGSAASQAEVLDQVGAAVAALSAASELLAEKNAEKMEQLSQAVITRAIDLAAMIIGRELEIAVNPGADALARCLAIAPATDDMVAHLHPDDIATLADLASGVGGLGSDQSSLAASQFHLDDAGRLSVGAAHGITLIPDDRLERGDAVMMVDQTIIDARLSAAFDRVAEALR